MPTGTTEIRESEKNGCYDKSITFLLQAIVEATCSIAKRHHPYVKFVDTIELENCMVYFSPIVRMTIRVPGKALLAFVLKRFLTKRLRGRSSDVILLVSCAIVQLIQQSMRKMVYL